MKVNILKYFSISIVILLSIIIYLSLVGLETERFNNQIKSKIIQANKNLDLELKKIKLTLDLFNFKVNAKTVGATVLYSKRPLPLEYIKTKVSIFWL